VIEVEHGVEVEVEVVTASYFTALEVDVVHGVDVEVLELYFGELVVDVDQVVYI
jgi:hypothetical protein